MATTEVVTPPTETQPTNLKVAQVVLESIIANNNAGIIVVDAAVAPGATSPFGGAAFNDATARTPTPVAPGANTPFGGAVFNNALNVSTTSIRSGVVVQDVFDVRTASIIVVNGETKENAPPICVRTGDAPRSGEPSNTPGTSYGKVNNTCVDETNKKRSHVCDFISEMQKNISLKKYTKAIGKAIREAIQNVMKFLGLTDRTGKFSYIINKLKAFAAELRRINKEILQPIIDFERYVLAYITKIRALIQWLLSLPAALLALLVDCLARLLKLIGSVFSDIVSEAISGDFGDSEFSELISAAKEVVQATGETISKVVEATTLAIEIPIAATAGILIPVSQSELDAANTTIQQYTSENPTLSDITNAGQNKLAQFGYPDKEYLNDQLVSLTKPAI